MTKKPMRRVRSVGKDTTLTSLTKRTRVRAGDYLAAERLRAGLTQLELSQKLGFRTYSMVSLLEHGKTNFPLNLCEQYARALDLEPQAFARRVLEFYEPELHRVLFSSKDGGDPIGHPDSNKKPKTD